MYTDKLAALKDAKRNTDGDEDFYLTENHVMPDCEDSPEHFPTALCWCEPELVSDESESGGARVWMHRDIH